MAHYAKIENDIVTNVIVIANEEENSLGEAGMELKLKTLMGGTWKKTSYNGSIRKNYCGIGYTFDSVRDAFIPSKPYPSWTLIELTCQWEAPTPYPTDGLIYNWDEVTLSWIERT